MRTVRRGMVAAALALPLAFGAAGVAAAEDKGDFNAQYASYEANYALAGPKGAVAGNVSSAAAGVNFEADKNGKDKDKNGDHGKGKKSAQGDDATMRSDDARHGKDKDKDKNGGKEAGWAGYDESGAAAGAGGAAAWDIESEAAYIDKD